MANSDFDFEQALRVLDIHDTEEEIVIGSNAKKNKSPNSASTKDMPTVDNLDREERRTNFSGSLIIPLPGSVIDDEPLREVDVIGPLEQEGPVLCPVEKFDCELSRDFSMGATQENVARVLEFARHAFEFTDSTFMYDGMDAGVQSVSPPTGDCAMRAAAFTQGCYEDPSTPDNPTVPYNTPPASRDSSRNQSVAGCSSSEAVIKRRMWSKEASDSCQKIEQSFLTSISGNRAEWYVMDEYMSQVMTEVRERASTDPEIAQQLEEIENSRYMQMGKQMKTYMEMLTSRWHHRGMLVYPQLMQNLDTLISTYEVANEDAKLMINKQKEIDAKFEMESSQQQYLQAKMSSSMSESGYDISNGPILPFMNQMPR